VLSAKRLQRRRLGRTSIEVGPLSLGCVTFGREIDEPASFAILDAALDAGIELLDTAEAYGGGQSREGRRRALGIEDVREVTGEFHSSELILGRWLADRGCRDRVVVQTKVLPPLDGPRVLEAIDASLRRLRTDSIDLFLFHAPDPRTPIGESLEAVGGAIRAGKVRFAGCSNFDAEQLRAALDLADASGLPRLDVAQFNYNLAVREAEQSLLPLCRARRVGVQTYSPLGAGFLTGKYAPSTGELPAGSRFDVVPGHRDVYFHPEKFAAAQRLRELSMRTGIPVPQAAVAWVLSNEDVDTVLIGARTVDHIASAVGALDIPFDPAWEPLLR
jgi:aryl-alcohol dehydrogenase-like predicted oxidoreductase